MRAFQDARRFAAAISIALFAVLAAMPAAAQTPPSAVQVLERYVAAMGGREALARHSHRHVVTEMTMAGLTMHLETWQARPDSIVSVATLAGYGSTRRGYDGTTGWEIPVAGDARLLTGDELASIAREATFDVPLRLLAAASTVTEGVILSTAQSRACWLVRLAQAAVEESYCFDVETGLLLEGRGQAPGQPETVLQVENYRVFDGIKLPTRLRAQAAGTEIISNTVSVSHEPAPPGVFDLPPAVRALAPTR